MGAMKEYFMEELEEREMMYEAYMNGVVQGHPIEAIAEVASYMRRHQIDFLIFLDQMSAPSGDCMTLKDDELCKRDFLRHEIMEKACNKNIVVLKNSIAHYIKENILGFYFQ